MMIPDLFNAAAISGVLLVTGMHGVSLRQSCLATGQGGLITVKTGLRCN